MTERIRALMDEDPLGPVDTELSDVSEDTIDKALGDAGLGVLSAEAQNIGLALTSSVAGLEPETRNRFVKAAGRGLQSRRDSLTPLPRLLFLARQTPTGSIASVATFVSVNSEIVPKVDVEKSHWRLWGSRR